MPDCESKKKWDKKNVIFATTKLFKTTDADIIEFLEGKSRSTVFKAALREYMNNHKEENDNG